MPPFSILMFCFSGALLLYAGLLYATKDVGLIPRREMVKIKDEKAYAVAFAKMLAVVGLAPMAAGFCGLFSVGLGMVALVVDMVLCIWVGTYFFRDLM